MCFNWLYLVSTTNIPNGPRTRKMQEMKHFLRGQGSIWVTVRNVYLVSYLLMHVETDTLLTLLRNCMLLCFFGLCCMGGRLCWAYFSTTPPLRCVGTVNKYWTDLLNFYFPCCCHWGYHRHWTPFLLTAFVRFWETLLFASRLPC